MILAFQIKREFSSIFVYSCDFFVEPDWKLGNIMTNRLVDMLNSSAQNRFGQLKARLPQKCHNCKWLQTCRGGCTKDRFHNLSNAELNHFCESYQMFFEHADKRFKDLASAWKRQQTPMESYGTQQEVPKVGRNDPCPCGSGLKHKKCCGKNI